MSDDPRTTTADANVSRMLDAPLRTAPGSAAFVQVDEAGRSDQVLTFARLDTLIGAFAGGLRDHGVSFGCRVLLVLGPGVDLTIAMFATWRIGAVVTILPPDTDRKRVDHVARLLDADAIVLDARAAVLRATSGGVRAVELAVVAGSKRIPTTVRFSDLLATPPTRHVMQPVRVEPGDVAFLVPPNDADAGARAEPRTHGGLSRRHAAMRYLWPDLDGGLLWTNIPEATIHGLSRGVGTILAPRPPARTRERDSRRLHRLIDASGATALVLDAVSMAGIAQAPGRAQLARVTHACTGGPLVTPELLDSLRAVLPNATIATVYGSREAGAVALATASDVLARRGDLRDDGGVFIGRVDDDLPTRIVRVVDGPVRLEPGSLLADWEQAAGTPGELLVRAAPGEAIDDDARVVLDEEDAAWMRTRHIVRRDEDGGLWLLGRRGEGWNVAGRRMWALQLETPVTDLPEVERAAVCMPKFAGTDREFKNASAVLAVQPARGYEREDARQAAVRSLRARGLDVAVEVRALRRIPVQRHDPTRVDVAALHERLKPENNEDY